MNTQKHLETIVNQIYEGLSDNLYDNICYLKEQMRYYQKHDCGPEVLAYCLKLFDELIPSEQRITFQKLLRQTYNKTDTLLNTIQFNISAHHYSTAQSQLKQLIRNTETLNLFIDDDKTAYRCFDELFDEILYRHYHPSSKIIKRPSVPYDRIYYLQGKLLSSLGKYHEAQSYYKKALHWNPTGFKILLAYIDSFKQIGDLSNVYRLISNSFKIAYRPQDISECFEYLISVFYAQKHYDAALACMHLSRRFKIANRYSTINSESIMDLNDRSMLRFTDERIRGIADDFGFPIGASPDIIQMAYHYGYHFLTEHQEPLANYFLSIALKLDDDFMPKQMPLRFDYHSQKHPKYSC